MEKPPSRLIKKSSNEQGSRLVGKSIDEAREIRQRNESSGEITELYVDMRLQQRDAPEKEWHIEDIFPERNIVLLRRSDGATVSKNIQRFLEQLNTPGSSWSKRE